VDDDALHVHARGLAKLPRLTADEERELGRRIQDGDQDALRRLVEATCAVVSYTKRYRGIGVPFLDLIHEGNLGLMEAARRFDPDRNVKFITYAVWWVRQSIAHALSGQIRAFTIRRSRRRRALRARCRSCRPARTGADDQRDRARSPHLGVRRRHAAADRIMRATCP
jgi:RNA polymerase sigma factor (sigma-70 family)